MDLRSVFGHEDQKKTLIRAHASGRLSHAYLFEGPSGVGKKTLAKRFAQGLFCEGSFPIPCDECPSCKQILAGEHPDLFLIEPGKDSIKNEQVESFQQFVQTKPYRAPHKVVLLDRAHQMTPRAQNRLLKTLEEPPGHTFLFLISENASALLDTLRSRLLPITFHRLPEEILIRLLVERFGCSYTEGENLARLSGGSCERALALMEREDFFGLRTLVIEVFMELLEGRGEAVLRKVEKFKEAKSSFDDILYILKHLFRDLMLIKAGAREDLLIHQDEVKRLRSKRHLMTRQGIAYALSEIDAVEKMNQQNIQEETLLDFLFVNLLSA